MRVVPTAIPGVLVAETSSFCDSRGSFARLFCSQDLGEIIAQRRIVQINHSRTTAAGTVRGLHFQRPPHAEMKLVRCIKGRVWDVALDLRAGSPTFLHWHAQELTPQNGCMMIIPEGCAHGFQTLDGDSEMLYLHTAPYAPEAEGGIRYDDPRFNIRWPLPITEISPRDLGHPLTSQDFPGIRL